MATTVSATLWVLLFVQCGSTCVDYNAAVTEGVSMDLKDSRVLPDMSVYDCAAACLRLTGCIAISLDTETLTCYLSSTTTDQTDVIPQPGFLFSYIKHWPWTLAGACSNISCPSGSSCEIGRHQKPFCNTEHLPECGLPKPVDGASVTYDSRSQSSVARYKCKDGYVQCHQNATSVCQESGQWGEVGAGMCQQSRWTNPGLPFKENSPCHGNTNVRVFIQGIPLRTTRFSINLENGAHRLCHVKSLHNWKMIMNTKYGFWGNEVSSRVFPLNVGDAFNMELSFGNGVCEFMINNIHIFAVNRARPGDKVRVVDVGGDFQLHKVEINSEK